LKVQLDQKYKDVLVFIHTYFGGYLGYRKTQDTYYYSSTSFASAELFMNYFDKHNLLSSKFINYKK